jgi:hypothetical protein
MSFKNKQASKYGEKSNMATTSRMNSQADMTTDPPIQGKDIYRRIVTVYII